MSLKKQLAHNTAAQVGGKIISTLLGLIAIGILTRYLGTEQFGWYITTLAFLQFFAILIDFGLIPVTAQMMSEVPKEIPDDPHALSSYRARLMKNLLGFRFATAIVGLGIAPIIAIFFPYPIEVKIAILFTTINMLSVSMNQIFIGYYQSKLSTYIQALGEVVGRIALIIGLVLCLYFQWPFIPVMWAITLSSVVYTTVMWLYAKKTTSVTLAYDPVLWKKIAIKMWPIAISIMFNVIYLKGDTIILSLFQNQHEVGLYGAAYRVIDIVAQIAMMIMGLILPLLAYAWSKKDIATFKSHLQLSFNIMMLLAIPMVAILITLSERIMVFVAGEPFRDAAFPLILLSISVVGIFIGGIFGHVAVAINRQKETIWVYALTALMTTILYIVFIPIFGITGAAWGRVFSELCAGILLYITISKFTSLSLSFDVTIKALLAGLCMTTVLEIMNTIPFLVSLTTGLDPYSPTHTLTKGLLLCFSILSGGSVYALTIILTKAISPETLAEVLTLKKSS